jgi:4a-hydroxytetrahydrobiopterin dehydratase
MSQTGYAQKHCKPCEGKMPSLKKPEIQKALKQIDGWDYKNGQIVKSFSFKNFYETVSFVNAVAWVADREDHHPEISFGYKNCKVSYSTHAVNGISENDFICAAKIDALLK